MQWVELLPIINNRPNEFLIRHTHDGKGELHVRQWYFVDVHELKDVLFQNIKMSSTLVKVAKIGEEIGDVKNELCWWLINTKNERSQQIQKLQEFSNGLTPLEYPKVEQIKEMRDILEHWIALQGADKDTDMSALQNAAETDAN